MALTFPPSPSPSPSPPFSSAYLPSPSSSSSPSPFTVYLSRWNNANAEPFNRRRRAQEQIESEIRLHRRFSSAQSILPPSTSLPPSSPYLHFKSHGSPSSPSSPSIPGRFSKYSKPPPDYSHTNGNHPAFRQIRPRPVPPPVTAPDGEDPIRVSEKGVSYKLKDAPFEFQYSYTETPKVKPLALREPPFLPFGPKDTPRPWTGRAPLPPSKKKLPEFDSFKLPPPGKKGVKPVQSPGPFLAGSGGPRYTAASREEILGEPLSEEEVAELVKGCLKTKRQLNMGRDGFTHNMLENIHSHWKRRRVCKIKCKGVCTVDLDNVCQQLEEKTGGKVIHQQGGVIYLFRGRNYNYKTRPRFPLMLWRPVSPVYPRLVKRVPDGLTLEEAIGMRKRGRDVPPMCKLGKNGVYINLVKQVREAFEVCELVRINCRGMNKSDYKKIGAKLQDLVPCVLLSFEFEHILMWRGRDWKSSLPSIGTDGSDQVVSLSANNSLLVNADLKSDTCSDAISGMVNAVVTANMPMENSAESVEVAQTFSGLKSDTCSDAISSRVDEVVTANMPMESSTKSAEDAQSFSVEDANEGPSTKTEVTPKTEESKGAGTKMLHLEGVRLLLDQAIESGIATSLSEVEYPDADIVYQRSVELAKTARLGPTVLVRVRMKESKGDNDEKHAMLESLEEEVGNNLVPAVSERRGGDIKKGGSNKRKDNKNSLLEGLPTVVPHGSLRVDELAKLLS